MPFKLDLRHETLNYTGQYARPTLELWGSGGLMVKGLLDALGPHGVTLQQIVLSGNMPNAAETVVTAHVPNVGVVKFAFDKLEFNFSNFSTAFVEAMPQTMVGLVSWIAKAVPDFKFASHRFSYYSHSFVVESTPQEALKALSVRELKSAGISVGSGAIFHYTIPSKKWETQLLIDKSLYLTGGLFISLDVRLNTGEINYFEMLIDARKYLADILAELGLVLPETVDTVN
jgi:hypothetical protein